MTFHASFCISNSCSHIVTLGSLRHYVLTITPSDSDDDCQVALLFTLFPPITLISITAVSLHYCITAKYTSKIYKVLHLNENVPTYLINVNHYFFLASRAGPLTIIQCFFALLPFRILREYFRLIWVVRQLVLIIYPKLC